MKLYLRTKSVLDERETLEMYRIEHRGLWAMYLLLCAAVVVQLLFGAGAAQLAGEVAVIAVTSVGLIIAYARRGIWDAHARPSVRGNLAYSALTALGVTVVLLGRRLNWPLALGGGAAAFALCFLLLCALMAYVRHRQQLEEETLDAEDGDGPPPQG